MIELGKIANYRVEELTPAGTWFVNSNKDRVLLPREDQNQNLKIGQEVEAFTYTNREGLKVLTLEEPFIALNEIEMLEVVGLSESGAFLDWGLPEDLFLPRSLINIKMEKGDFIPVKLFVDDRQRLVASTNIEELFVDPSTFLSLRQKVNLLITKITDLGYKAIINDKCEGLLYRNEVFDDLQPGDHTTGYVKKIRDDHRVDLILDAPAHELRDDLELSILEELKKNNGRLEFDDHVDAELIYQLFKVSKRKFKVALGALYKKRLVAIESGRITLNAQSK